MATIKEFAEITRRVIARNGFEGHLPTALYPARKHIVALEGVPTDADIEAVALAWATKNAMGDEEFLVAFKVDAKSFKIVRRHSGTQEEGVFNAGEDA